MIHVEPFVPSEVCLACDGCCRYAEHDSVWAPLFLFDEIVELTQKNIVPSCLFTHAANKPGRPARINLVEEKGQLFCSCLSPKDNVCRIYDLRPLDCRLYPFLLVRQDGTAYLAVDMKCPYARKTIDTAAGRAYAARLAGFLQSPEVGQIIRENSEMIQAYPADYRILQPLPF